MSSTVLSLATDLTPAEMDEALLIDAMTVAPKGGFISLRGYVNREGEVAHHLINGAVSYERCLIRSLDAIKDLDAETIAAQCPAAGGDHVLAQRALDAVRASWSASLAKHQAGEGTDSGYASIAPGLATREGEAALYVWGLAVNKEVVVPVAYRPVNSKPLTLVKRFIERDSAVSKFRRFKLEPGSFESVSVAGRTIGGSPSQQAAG